MDRYLSFVTQQAILHWIIIYVLDVLAPVSPARKLTAEQQGRCLSGYERPHHGLAFTG